MASGFANREAAGRELAQRLTHLREDAGAGGGVVVLGLPRGGVPVAAQVARALSAPLDVIVVRKLGLPWQPELAMGAIGEDGAMVLNEDIARAVSQADLERVVAQERAELARRVAAVARRPERVPLDGPDRGDRR